MKEKENIEEKEDKEVIIENISTKINFYGEQIDVQLNSDFNSFVNNICNILNIPLDKFNSLAITYNDEDGDNIILSTEEDYILYFQQLKDKTVNGLIVEIKEDSEINPIDCFDSALDYKQQIDEANVQILNEENNLNKDIDNNINNNLKDNLINNNINYNMVNNNDNIQDNLDINNNNLIVNKNHEKDIPIDDLVFHHFECTSCKTYPIICILNYCPQCQIHICENCIKNFGNHIHPFLKFESYKELLKIKEEEKTEQMNNNNQNINKVPNININNSNFMNGNKNYEKFNFPHILPFRLIKNDRFKDYIRKRRQMFPGLCSHKNGRKYMGIIRKARKSYNLEGIDDNQLMEALIKTNGNIDQAIISLTK